MNNSEFPASPTTINIDEYKGTINCPYNKPLTGLTKREHFAGLAMQALLSNSVMGDSNLWEAPQEWVKQMTEAGVEMADALLKELDK